MFHGFRMKAQGRAAVQPAASRGWIGSQDTESNLLGDSREDCTMVYKDSIVVISLENSTITTLSIKAARNVCQRRLRQIYQIYIETRDSSPRDGFSEGIG